MATTIKDIEALGWYTVALARCDEGNPTVPDIYSVSGDGFDNVQVQTAQLSGEGATEEDQAILDSLLDEQAMNERVSQVVALGGPRRLEEV